jgi:HSP20 family protein
MADEQSKTSSTSTQGQTGTTTLEPEHHQTQAATGSPQAGATAQGSYTGSQTAGSSTGASATATGTTPGATPGASSQLGTSSGSQGSPWSPGSTSGTRDTGSSGLSRQGSSLPSLGGLGLWNPLAMIDRFFDDFFGYSGFGRSRPSSSLSSYNRDLTGSSSSQGGGGLWYPQVEVRERDGKLVVCADLPGARKEDVHVEVRDNALILQGERRQESEHNEGGFYRSERSYGHFQRVIPLPEGVNPEQAQANFKDGVLEITLPLPQRESPQGRRIEIT